MKVSYNWLKDFVDIQVSPIQLSNDLVQIGFEVEELIDLSKEIQGVVVGKITDIQPHPNADKLRICQVDVGDKSVQIITHADNVFVGAYVPAALDGAYLPGGKRIFDGELRGLPSYGMMCAGEELGLTEADFPNGGVDGIMLLDEYPLGTDINKIIGNDDIRKILNQMLSKYSKVICWFCLAPEDEDNKFLIYEIFERRCTCL